MVHRFKKLIRDNPMIDQIDLFSDNFYLNGGRRIETASQSFPEYSQQRYLRMRLSEEAYALYDYLDPAYNKKFQLYLNANPDLD